MTVMGGGRTGNRGERQAGQGFIGILLALLVVALLVLVWLRGGGLRTESGKSPLERRKEAGEAACEVNRREIARRLSIQTSLAPPIEGGVPAGPSPEQVAAFARCPSGGRYTVAAGRVTCSIHGPFRAETATEVDGRSTPAGGTR